VILSVAVDAAVAEALFSDMVWVAVVVEGIVVVAVVVGGFVVVAVVVVAVVRSGVSSGGKGQ
jgi:F0F1-type ATP synthase membrane subunit c/vacuolar-type H+-ATPase subunit K